MSRRRDVCALARSLAVGWRGESGRCCASLDGGERRTTRGGDGGERRRAAASDGERRRATASDGGGGRRRETGRQNIGTQTTAAACWPHAVSASERSNARPPSGQQSALASERVGVLRRAARRKTRGKKRKAAGRRRRVFCDGAAALALFLLGSRFHVCWRARTTRAKSRQFFSGANGRQRFVLFARVWRSSGAASCGTSFGMFFCKQSTKCFSTGFGVFFYSRARDLSRSARLAISAYFGRRL